jgi:hypothetical protein
LTADPDKISKLIDNMETDVKGIRREILKLCWYMRGGLTYEEGMQLGYIERQLISDIVKDNLETTKKTNLPFF